jgi:ring-1,2-phenylacetyl-CoA epoxidase subunit PaaD
MVVDKKISVEEIWKILEKVCDPEVPVLSILDLGIVRDVKTNDETVEVIITPTYTGCPAMDMIAMNIRLALIENGYNKIKIIAVLSPAWTTDWMSEAGKEKIKSLWHCTANARVSRYDTIG